MKIEFQQYISERLYPLGFQFSLKRGKQDKKELTIIDYAITHNSKGEVKAFNYVCSYEFCGQKMTESFVQTTIDIATNNGWQNSLDKENQELFDLFNNDLSAGLTFTTKDDLLFEIKMFKERDSDYCSWSCSSEAARDNNSLNEAFEALEKLESNLKA